MADHLRALTEAGVLADIDLYFGESMADLGGTPAVCLSAAAVSAMYRAGHACLPLAEAGKPIAAVVPRATSDGDEATGRATQVRLPTHDAWRDALAASPVVASDGAFDPPRPLVLDRDRLYLHRLHQAECRLAERVLELATRRAREPAADATGFPQIPDDAVQAALDGLCIVTGGPGTGKTTLAASLIGLLVAAGAAKPWRIGLVAPTGKAATRLQEAVKTQLGARGLCNRVPALADFQPDASTIHRLLTRSALPLDALIVDECSMVDLSLMTRLTDVLPDACRLILLGDAEQLASVEPGSVFSDLCGVGEDSPLASCIVRLTESHRFDPSRGIGRLADAIVHGDATAALATLQSDADGQTGLNPLDDEAAFEAFAGECAAQWRSHITALRTEPEATPPFPSRRVLCAHRHGPYGVNRLNRLVERRLRDVGAIGDDEFFVGRPIIVTRNDRHTGLSNGDTGVVVDVDGRHQVWFPELDQADGRFLVSPSRLPQHESFFALTVHRAQGSEYDEVLFVPGDAASQVCTRELFYTAVTRARRQVTVLAQEQTVRAAVERVTTRASGLGTRLE
ncbi:MAG: exodeoxyribonuclease V subunit alpha [Gammaproteobacteria bacterium]|nr:exodeoxyribonuclease V subunit alpha [Gammaproteobacteria bacterium]